MNLEYCRAGYGSPHISDVIAIYARHRDTMLKAIAEYLPDATLA